VNAIIDITLTYPPNRPPNNSFLEYPTKIYDLKNLEPSSDQDINQLLVKNPLSQR